MQVLIDTAKGHRTAFVPLIREGVGRNMSETASIMEALLPQWTPGETHGLQG